MALTRKMLKAMGIEDEKIDQIIDAHSETVDALKEERDTYKEDTSKLPDLQKKLDEALEAAKNTDPDAWQEKYNLLKKDFDDYKSDQTAKETTAKKTKAYRDLLKEVGVSEKRIDSILKISGVDNINLDKDGNIKDVDNLKESIKTEWSDFIETSHVSGANTATPPANTGGTKMTKADIYAKDDHGRYKLSSQERQQAIANNPDAFQ